MSKKIVVKLGLHDSKDKQKAMKAVSSLVGIDDISMDVAAQRMTVIGMVDPVNVVGKLRKASWAAAIESVGPAKEPEKEDKKDGGDAKKPPPPTEQQILAYLMNQYRAYYPYPSSHYFVQSMEENPNSCAIC